jgi:Secretion system C-terminal sorting domain
MPNRVNGLVESYAKVYATTGILIGKDYSANADSAKEYGWLVTKKYTDVLKTLSGGLQTGYPNHGFDLFANTKPLVKKQSSLPSSKYNNILLADLLTMKVNIAMSSIGMTPVGFGELLYNGGGSNPLNGKMVREISAYGDSVIMGWQVDSSYLKGTKTIHVAVHKFADPTTFVNLDSIVHKINAAFEGAIDTNYFADSLIYKGVRMLEGITFLQANPNVIPARVIPLVTGPVNDVPLAYKLEQNYPNPFNPTTTIQFSLMNPSIVTLKIYNVLGQEVATLLNNAQLNDGVQSLSWNANNFASGVYFYRLSVEGTSTDDNGNAVGTGKTSFQQVKKMLLVK